jgi:hypothetical protein
MAAVHIEKIIEKDGEISLTGLPFKKGERVELTLSSEPAETTARRFITARELLNSEIIGMWKDREDIGDSSEFARKLREKAQRRWQ